MNEFLEYSVIRQINNLPKKIDGTVRWNNDFMSLCIEKIYNEDIFRLKNYKTVLMDDRGNIAGYYKRPIPIFTVSIEDVIWETFSIGSYDIGSYQFVISSKKFFVDFEYFDFSENSVKRIAEERILSLEFMCSSCISLQGIGLLKEPFEIRSYRGQGLFLYRNRPVPYKNEEGEWIFPQSGGLTKAAM